MTAVLRPATAADAPAVAQILIDTRAAFMPYAPSAHGDDEIRGWVASTLLPSHAVTVAENDGAVVALAATTVEDSIGWILHMAVTPARVGQGIGTRLLLHTLAALPRPLRLWTFQANAGARRWYERNGFTALRFTDGDNEERCPDVLYERTAR